MLPTEVVEGIHVPNPDELLPLDQRVHLALPPSCRIALHRRFG